MCDLLGGRDTDLLKQSVAQGRPAVNSAGGWMNEGRNDVNSHSPQALQDCTVVGVLPDNDGGSKVGKNW